MKKKPTHVELTNLVEVLGTNKVYSLTQVCDICSLERSIVLEFIDYDVIRSDSENDLYFAQSQLDRLLKGIRLKRDLELNHAGVALALDLLETIDELKLEVSKLRKLSIHNFP